MLNFEIYHGTSEAFLESILQYGFRRSDNFFEEMYQVCKKYIKKEALTVKFIKEELSKIDKTYYFKLRERQNDSGKGIFYTTMLDHAYDYAKQTALNSRGELEILFTDYLNGYPKESIPAIYDALLPQYKNEEKGVIYIEKPQTSQPIVLKIKTDLDNLAELPQDYEKHLNYFRTAFSNCYNERTLNCPPVNEIEAISIDGKNFLSVEEFLQQRTKDMKNGEKIPYNPQELLEKYKEKISKESGLSVFENLNENTPFEKLVVATSLSALPFYGSEYEARKQMRLANKIMSQFEGQNDMIAELAFSSAIKTTYSLLDTYPNLNNQALDIFKKGVKPKFKERISQVFYSENLQMLANKISSSKDLNHECQKLMRAYRSNICKQNIAQERG